MSVERPQSPDWEQSDALDERLTDPQELEFPDDWTLTESWQRAQRERDRGGTINEAERMVWLTESDNPKRVLFALEDDRLKAECSCKSWQFRGWCAHVAHCWWSWCNRGLVVHHLDTGRDYELPPAWLRFGDEHSRRDLDGLTPAELDAYLTCELGEIGVTEYANKTDRVKGTIGNLLGRAREKVEGQR